MGGLAKQDTRPQTQARPLHEHSLEPIRTTACTPRHYAGRARRMESPQVAQVRGWQDIAMASVLRDCLLRVSEAAALRWGNVELAEDGTGRITIARSKTDQEGGRGRSFSSAPWPPRT